MIFMDKYLSDHNLIERGHKLGIDDRDDDAAEPLTGILQMVSWQQIITAGTSFAACGLGPSTKQ